MLTAATFHSVIDPPYVVAAVAGLEIQLLTAVSMFASVSRENVGAAVGLRDGADVGGAVGGSVGKAVGESVGLKTHNTSEHLPILNAPSRLALPCDVSADHTYGSAHLCVGAAEG